ETPATAISMLSAVLIKWYATRRLSLTIQVLPLPPARLWLAMPASPLEVCLEAAKLGGQALLHWRDRFQTREKGPRDLVTQADLAAQEAIRGVVCKAFPDHDYLS